MIPEIDKGALRNSDYIGECKAMGLEVLPPDINESDGDFTPVYKDGDGDRKGVIQTKIDFHNKILQIEEFLTERRMNQVWGMSGGSCGLCHICRARMGEPCLYPDKARSSLEAIAVDVLALLDKLGLDNKFYADRITWTGCVLFP